ncbi:protein kinase [Virgibacillus soli]|uniref:non-specific serine/threonine protein kinase n=1 Tax=Paracerasibacillus soli TaxID=480284 RepID=A0ABU5CS47_9BACI|nr:protein kinase [Virgibacillus soli]MDY0408701.1 protein kinase [Virgibacillus soli]
MLKIGDIVDDRYEVLKEIGRGGMSVVYLAMDNRLNKSLVIKDIRKKDTINNELLVNSLVVEANMLKKLDHHALPRIYDIIESSGDIYIVMDYIEGESLKQKLMREGVLPAEDVIEWAKQLTDVLNYLHTRKPNPIIYRDMKPDNIMITPEGQVKLIDFGIAREYKQEKTTDTTNLGTKAYAAPEQISGKQTDARTDIYSLGITLYQLITGKTLNDPPFEVKPIRYWDSTLPEGLEIIIEYCTQLEPENRYQSSAELLHDLDNIEKLTQGYKKMLYKKLVKFFVPLVLFLTFSISTVFGYNGMQKEQFQDYTRIINAANSNFIEGNTSESIKLLESAINLDGKRSEAYINLIDIYINRSNVISNEHHAGHEEKEQDSHRDEIEVGLQLVKSHIENKYGNTHKNNEVLYKMGMTYFDYQKNYQEALTYFRQVDQKEFPSVVYYKTLATAMSQLEIDYDKFVDELVSFEAFNDSLPNNYKKVDNYHALINIYSSYRNFIDNANTKSIEIIEKAQQVLTLIDEDSLNLKYELSLELKLAQAYHSRGLSRKYDTEFEDPQLAYDDFKHANMHYQTLIDLEVTNQEDIMVTIGTILQEMEKYAEAEQYFEEAIQKYPQSTKAYVKLINLLLDVEQIKENTSQNYEKAKATFEKSKKLHGIEDDESYKKLIRRFINLGLE